MAKKTTVRTDGFTDRYEVGDIVITPLGVEVSDDDLKTVKEAAFRSRVRLYTDSPKEGESAEITGTAASAEDITDPTNTTTTATTDTTSGARTKRS